MDDCLSFKDFCLKQNSKASYRRKLGGSAICSKYEQNSTALRSVAYLFFIIYQKSIEWTILNISCYLISATYTKAYRRKPKFIKEWVIKFRNKYVQKGFLNMKRVWAIAFFFFSMGLFAGFWITHDPMKIVICIGCDIIAYCLFFKWISIER